MFGNVSLMAQEPGVPINGMTLRAIRQIRGMTLEGLAELIGIDRSTLNNYELGNSRPPRTRLERIAAALAVKPAALDCSHLECATCHEGGPEARAVGAA